MGCGLPVGWEMLAKMLTNDAVDNVATQYCIYANDILHEQWANWNVHGIPVLVRLPLLVLMMISSHGHIQGKKIYKLVKRKSNNILLKR